MTIYNITRLKYLGIVLSIGLAAPAVGYILGAFTLKLWVDVGWVDACE